MDIPTAEETKIKTQKIIERNRNLEKNRVLDGVLRSISYSSNKGFYHVQIVMWESDLDEYQKVKILLEKQGYIVCFKTFKFVSGLSKEILIQW